MTPSSASGTFANFILRSTKPNGAGRARAAWIAACPFCQSGVQIGGMFTGCPVHNLIPEWNDMLYLGNYEHALSRLIKVDCFPEFTGRRLPRAVRGGVYLRPERRTGHHPRQRARDHRGRFRAGPDQAGTPPRCALGARWRSSEAALPASQLHTPSTGAGT